MTGLSVIIPGTIEGSVGETTNGNQGHTGGPKNRKNKFTSGGGGSMVRAFPKWNFP